MRKHVVMQPGFNPWVGYFDLLDQSDVFVFYDNVQLTKQSWDVRNRIKTVNGELFLSIPYIKQGDWRELLLCQALTNDSLPWRKKHMKSIENAYRRAPFFEEVISLVNDVYKSDLNTVSAFNINFTKQIASLIGIRSQIIKSSDLPNFPGNKDLRLANMLKFLGANTYLSPKGAADYIEKESPGGELVKTGIEVFYHNYQHPVYSQMYGEFIPFMGILDLLFNVGFKNSLEIVRSGRLEPIHYSRFTKPLQS